MDLKMVQKVKKLKKQQIRFFPKDVFLSYNSKFNTIYCPGLRVQVLLIYIFNGHSMKIFGSDKIVARPLAIVGLEG